jgi:hypothetical protein
VFNLMPATLNAPQHRSRVSPVRLGLRACSPSGSAEPAEVRYPNWTSTLIWTPRTTRLGWAELALAGCVWPVGVQETTDAKPCQSEKIRKLYRIAPLVFR